MNYGFNLSFTSDKEHVENCVKYQTIRNKVRIMFSDNLDNIYQKIKKDWTFGDWVCAGPHNRKRRDYYFNNKEVFVIIVRNLGIFDTMSMIDQIPVNRIEFVTSTKENLENTIKSFGLPYDKEQVRTN